MSRRFPIALMIFVAAICGSAAVMDRIAVIVGRRAIKLSDIDRDLRVTAFLNRQQLNHSEQTMRQAAERLIDQELVRQEMLNGQFATPTDQDVNALLQQLVRDRFGGSQAALNAELRRYGLTQEQLRKQLLWQLTVLRFIDQRFRAGVLVTDEEATDYYNQHQAELAKAYPRDHSLQALLPKIRETVTGERINQAFDEWVKEARRNARIDYRQQAFTEGATQ